MYFCLAQRIPIFALGCNFGAGICPNRITLIMDIDRNCACPEVPLSGLSLFDGFFYLLQFETGFLKFCIR